MTVSMVNNAVNTAVSSGRKKVDMANKSRKSKNKKSKAVIKKWM